MSEGEAGATEAPSLSSLARGAVRTWRAGAGGALVLVAAVGCCFTALTNHLGFSSALVLAVVGCLGAGLWGSGLARALYSRSAGPVPAGSALAVALGGGLALPLFGALLIAVRSLFGSPCAPLQGLAFVALVALPGPVLAALLGLLGTALVPKRRKLSVALAIAPLPVTVLASLWRFYDSPAVFAYDPLFGFFPGALYDERIALDATLASYRLGTLGWVLAFAGVFAALWSPAQKRLAARWQQAHAGAWALALVGTALGLGIYAAGEPLGHRHSARDVATVLGGRVESARCTVVYARSIDARDALRTRDDCVLRLAQLESFFGVPPGPPVTVFLFANSEQKRVLMGAADTYIAKPWRHEVYLQRQAFPHPVLKHELAHVVAGAMAPGPLHVTATARFYPLPGLIEGAAVAAAWEGESDASPHEWAHAMLQLRQLPSVSALLGQGFYLHASGSAYTAAGSFSRWLIETRGAARFRDAYRDGDLQRAYGQSAQSLDEAWRRWLRANVPLPDRVLARARVRFRRAPLHQRACPHETAQLHDEARSWLDGGSLSTATRALREVVRRDPTELGARVELAEALARNNDDRGLAALMEESSRALGAAAVERLRGRVADTVWRWRGAEAARPLYRAIDVEVFDEDEARTFEVKRWAVGADPSLVEPPAWFSGAVRDLLVGREQLNPDPLAAVAQLERVEPGGAIDAPHATGSYLIARQLMSREHFTEAAALLDARAAEALPTQRMLAEGQRLRAVLRYHAGDGPGAIELLRPLADGVTRPRGARDAALDWIDRVQRQLPAR